MGQDRGQGQRAHPGRTTGFPSLKFLFTKHGFSFSSVPAPGLELGKQAQGSHVIAASEDSGDHSPSQSEGCDMWPEELLLLTPPWTLLLSSN